MKKQIFATLAIAYCSSAQAGSMFNGFSDEFIEKLKSQQKSINIENSSPLQVPNGQKFLHKNDGRLSVRIDDMLFKIPEDGNYAFEAGGRKWTDGVLYYAFDRVGSYKQKLFHDGCNLWGKRANVKCVKRTNQRNYVLVGAYGGNYSYVGMIGGEQELSLYNWDLDTIAHEVMHAYGFSHEQCRDDRDDHVKIQWENIKDGVDNNFYKDGSSSTPYDYYSVMHYDAWAFSKNGRKTIVPFDSSVNLRRMGNSSISDYDYQDIINEYGPNGIDPNPTTPDPTTPDPTDSLLIDSWGDLRSNNVSIKGKVFSEDAAFVSLYFQRGNEGMRPVTYEFVSEGDSFNLVAEKDSSVQAIYVILFDHQKNILKRIKRVL